MCCGTKHTFGYRSEIPKYRIGNIHFVRPQVCPKYCHVFACGRLGDRMSNVWYSAHTTGMQLMRMPSLFVEQLFPEPEEGFMCRNDVIACCANGQNGRSDGLPPGGISVSRIVSSSGFVYEYYTGLVRSVLVRVHVSPCQFMSHHVNVSVSRHTHKHTRERQTGTCTEHQHHLHG